MKKLIVFDLDGTLSESKISIKTEMANLLRQLLDKFQVAVTSGQSFDGFKTQLIEPLKATDQQLAHLHILPTNGTHYYRYDLDESQWQEVYSDDLPAEVRARISRVIETTSKQLGLWEASPEGAIIEDRGSQVTYSGLGQQAPLEARQAWDPDGSKKKKLRDAVAKQLPDFNVHTAGLTSIDVTIGGLDKATAIDKLKDVLGLKKADMLYIGDALAPGGNDAVVKAAGFEAIAVKGPAETAAQIQFLLNS